MTQIASAVSARGIGDYFSCERFLGRLVEPIITPPSRPRDDAIPVLPDGRHVARSGVRNLHPGAARPERHMKQRMLAVLVVLVAHLLGIQGAQAFPDRPIKLVVASPAGGPPDVMARLLSDKMAAVLGQPVIVDNRARRRWHDRSQIGRGRGAGRLHAGDGKHEHASHRAGDLQERGLHMREHSRRSRGVADSSEVLAVHPSVRRQIRGRIDRPGEVPAGRAELRFGRESERFPISKASS